MSNAFKLQWLALILLLQVSLLVECQHLESMPLVPVLDEEASARIALRGLKAENEEGVIKNAVALVKGGTNKVTAAAKSTVALVKGGKNKVTAAAKSTVEWVNVKKNKATDKAKACRDIAAFVTSMRGQCETILRDYAEEKRVACAVSAFNLLIKIFGRETMRGFIDREAHYNSCGSCADAADTMVHACRAGKKPHGPAANVKKLKL
ncbi:hypothetical protein LEN26_000174 [Aphanomyces euteiches]|nr:hypothetical protein AeMF1_001063 [Aphanomyces euteiches]KAH9164135.1 hypothetical protein LEN26_000174 [Aphanomyces euteiches]KAH9193992.1 hypothetical protein AeNC1_004038 [Aphanomyces euteiches]